MGTGINKIRTLLKEAGAASPQFEFGNFYSIIFQRKRNEPLSEPLAALLSEIKSNPYSTKDELSQKLGKSRATVTRQIKKLKDLSLLKRVGGDKSGYWKTVDNGTE